MNFLSHIASLIQINTDLKIELETIFSIKKFEKGETILNMRQGKEITSWFSQETLSRMRADF